MKEGRQPEELQKFVVDHPSNSESQKKVQCTQFNGLQFGESNSRLVSKNGNSNVRCAGISQKPKHFFVDIYTTMLELRWRWTLSVIILSYFVSWFLFAILWYLILYAHDDLNNVGKEGWEPCITDLQNFTSVFIFSAETQHTTGYGFYKITEKCPDAILLFGVQSIFGVITDGLLVGLFFMKMSRAKRRRETLIFSKNGVMCLMDGIWVFMARVGDMRKNHLLEVSIRSHIVFKNKTPKGEMICSQKEIKVAEEGNLDDRLLLYWPTTIAHKITEGSPMMPLLSPNDPFWNDIVSFEIIVTLEGVVESTGLKIQAKTSYLPTEILWNRQFENIVLQTTEGSDAVYDYSQFDSTVPLRSETAEDVL